MPDQPSSRGAERDSPVGQLILQCRAGDADAFTSLYHHHVGRIRAYARRLARHEQAADDLVAEAFARTWEQLRAGRGPDLAFMGYLRAVVLNLHLHHLRVDQGLEWISDIETAALANPDLAARVIEQSPEHLVLDQLFNSHLKQALASLPHRWQQALVMVYIENHPYAHVASQLGLSVEATRQLARRARLGMRHALATLIEDDDAVA